MKNSFLILVFFLVQPAVHGMDQNTFFATVTGFASPYAITTTPDSLRAYVTDGPDLRMIDTNPDSPTFNTIIPAPGLLGILDNAVCVAITPDGRFGYVTNFNTNTMILFDADPASNTYNTVLAAPGLVGVFNQPNSVAITPDGTRAYVINKGDNTVSVVSTVPSSPNYNTVVASINLNPDFVDPYSIEVTPNGKYTYVSTLNGAFNVIDSDPSSPTYNTLLSAPGLLAVNNQPQGFAITTDGTRLYTSNGGGLSASALNIDSSSPNFNSVLVTPGLDNAFNFSNDVACTLDGNYAYVTNFLGADGSVSSVSVIDTNPSSASYNTTLVTPGLTLPFITRFFTLAATPNGLYVYAVDGFNAVVNVIYTGIISTPLHFSGCIQKNIFLSQTEFSTILTWSAPDVGVPPVEYRIYTDAALTDLLATIPASDPLELVIRNINPRQTRTYYIVSVDDMNNLSIPATTTVSRLCQASAEFA